MESHKRTLAILHIVYSSMAVMTFLIVGTIIQSIYPFIRSEISSEEAVIFETIYHIVRMVVIILVIAVPLPSIIGSIALLNGKQWGLTILLVTGSLSLFSFPLGTALGAYTIWVYVRVQQNRPDDKNQG